MRRRRELLADIKWLYEVIEDQRAEIAALRAARDTPAGSTWASTAPMMTGHTGQFTYVGPPNYSVPGNITRV